MIPLLALDDAGRAMGYAGTVTNAEYLASQALLMDSVCMTEDAVAASDAFVDGFRYTSTGALRIHDATAGLPAVTNTNHGLLMTDDAQVCITTGAIGSGVAYLRGMALDSSGRLHTTLLDPVAWFRFNTGITTVTGVSQWDDVSGNANHLKQATGGNQPSLEADGSILFDGIDDYLKCDAFTFVQPETVYLLFKQVTWTGNDYIYDGETVGAGVLSLSQQNTTPNLQLSAGATLQSNPDLSIDTYGVIACVFNSTSSAIQTNGNSAVSGNGGALDGGGFLLGASGNVATFANIQVKEAILFAAAHDANSRIHVARYLAHNGLVF